MELHLEPGKICGFSILLCTKTYGNMVNDPTSKGHVPCLNVCWENRNRRPSIFPLNWACSRRSKRSFKETRPWCETPSMGTPGPWENICKSNPEDGKPIGKHLENRKHVENMWKTPKRKVAGSSIVTFSATKNRGHLTKRVTKNHLIFRVTLKMPILRVSLGCRKI